MIIGIDYHAIGQCVQPRHRAIIVNIIIFEELEKRKKKPLRNYECLLLKIFSTHIEIDPNPLLVHVCSKLASVSTCLRIMISMHDYSLVNTYTEKYNTSASLLFHSTPLPSIKAYQYYNSRPLTTTFHSLHPSPPPH